MAITLDRATVPTTAADELRRRPTERDGVEFLFAMFVDMHGKPCAKMVPVSAIDGLLADGAGFAGFAAGPMGQVPSSPDILAMPDLSSYMPAPWRPGLGIIQCDPYVEGEPWPFAPRVILRRQLERLAAAGYALKVGAEAEYFLVRRTPDGGIAVADPEDRAAAPCYDARALTRMYDHLTSVSRHMNTLGWANYANDHEDANGQFEQNFRYADPLTTADRVIVFRYMVHSLAAEAGMLATFMPKPFSHLTGNGLHMHLSLWDEDGAELFADPADARGLGHVGHGLLLHRRPARPRRGAHRRGLPDGELVQAAGQRAARLGRGLVAGLRHLRRQRPDPHAAGARPRPGGGPLHRRLGQPYLALSALDRRRARRHRAGPRPGRPLRAQPAQDRRGGGGRARVAGHADDAVARARPPRGRRRPARRPRQDPEGDYVDYFVATKRAEVRAAHAQVTPWELDRYLEAF